MATYSILLKLIALQTETANNLLVHVVVSWLIQYSQTLLCRSQ